MPLRFCANMTTMFPGVEPKTLRYGLAKKLGFRAVESWDMYDISETELAAAKSEAQVEHVLLNTPIGDATASEFGLASCPSRQEEFLSTLEQSFRYAKALDCRLLHVLAGSPITVHPEVADITYRKNLETAIKKGEQENIQILIEPISKVARPYYFLTDIHKVLKIVREFNHPFLRVQLDLFHLQLMCGNLTNTIKEIFPYIGHIQFAQAPDRHEPDSPGEINYRYIFSVLEHLGYDKWLGCEYIPKGRVEDGLHWIKDFGFSL